MTYREIPFFFDCLGCSLLGILAAPDKPSRVGVVIVVGGPQYRVGSHRQFVLLARKLAAANIPCLRFDCRGMGDSDGPRVSFEEIAIDIRAAVEALCSAQPTVQEVVLWGLCDGASASAMFADADPRIAGLALFNPWVRTSEGHAEAILKSHYTRRVIDPAFWRRLISGRVNLAKSANSVLRNLWAAIVGRFDRRMGSNAAESTGLPDRMASALARHGLPALVALSGRDIVAAEFRVATSREGSLLDREMRRSGRCTVEFEDADHTFSAEQWRKKAEHTTTKWLRENFQDRVSDLIAFPAESPKRN